MYSITSITINLATWTSNNLVHCWISSSWTFWWCHEFVVSLIIFFFSAAYPYEHTSSHFAAFFLTSIVMVFAAYVVYHNRQKVPNAVSLFFFLIFTYKPIDASYKLKLSNVRSYCYPFRAFSLGTFLSPCLLRWTFSLVNSRSLWHQIMMLNAAKLRFRFYAIWNKIATYVPILLARQEEKSMTSQEDICMGCWE